MDLSIIIVNWNSKKYLKKCIASILENTNEIECEILVFDSGSFDGCGEMLRQIYPFVRFIQSDTNVGFAKANNTAFKSSSGKTLLFLNPDTEIKGGAVKYLYRQLRASQNVGIVGAKLLNSDGSVQTSCVQAFPTILNQILDAEIFRSLWSKSNLFGNSCLFNNKNVPQEVEAISGACLMIKRSVYERIGMFSNDYFMYSEDIDICFKASRTGWRTYYVPNAIVVHHGGASSSQTAESDFSSVIMFESRWRFLRKTRSMFYCLLYRLALLVSCAVRICLLLILWPTIRLPRKRLSTEEVLRKWTARLRWTLGSEKWVKNF